MKHTSDDALLVTKKQSMSLLYFETSNPVEPLYVQKHVFTETLTVTSFEMLSWPLLHKP